MDQGPDHDDSLEEGQICSSPGRIKDSGNERGWDMSDSTFTETRFRQEEDLELDDAVTLLDYNDDITDGNASDVQEILQEDG